MMKPIPVRARTWTIQVSLKSLVVGATNPYAYPTRVLLGPGIRESIASLGTYVCTEPPFRPSTSLSGMLAYTQTREVA